MKKFQEAIAGDIVFFDNADKKKNVVGFDEFENCFEQDSCHVPIGVVVIPASHMEDGRARMMALRWMSCDDPENGSLNYQDMVWGSATDLTGLTNFTEVPIISSAINQTISGVRADGYLPSDYTNGYTGDTNPQDPGTKWCYNDNNRYIASPYASDGTPNPLYRATSYSRGSINNALSYFDGRHQTDVILAARGTKNYGSWKPVYNRPSDFPAVSVCDMYHTVGTSQGDWYLPSQAELGYVIARLSSINDAITKVNGMQDLPSYWAWSSSEYSSFNARYVNFRYGRVRYGGFKDYNSYPVVAFSLV